MKATGSRMYISLFSVPTTRQLTASASMWLFLSVHMHVMVVCMQTHVHTNTTVAYKQTHTHTHTHVWYMSALSHYTRHKLAYNTPALINLTIHIQLYPWTFGLSVFKIIHASSPWNLPFIWYRRVLFTATEDERILTTNELFLIYLCQRKRRREE